MTGFFRVFGFVAICVVLGSIAFWAVNRERPAPAASEQAVTAGPETSPPIVTLEAFNGLENGMTYEEAVKTIGTEGVLFTAIGSPPDSDAPPAKTIYTWTNPDASRATLVFENGALISKEQTGLQ